MCAICSKHKMDDEVDLCHPLCAATLDTGEPCPTSATFGPPPHGPLLFCAAHKGKVGVHSRACMHVPLAEALQGDEQMRRPENAQEDTCKTIARRPHFDLCRLRLASHEQDHLPVAAPRCQWQPSPSASAADPRQGMAFAAPCRRTARLVQGGGAAGRVHTPCLWSCLSWLRCDAML